MAPRARIRRSDVAPGGAGAPLTRRTAVPVLRLQGSIGNRAVGQVLARAPAEKNRGTVKVGKLPMIKIIGGNSDLWAAMKVPDTLDVVSEKGKHSAALEKLSNDRTKIPSVKLTALIADQGGNLNFGSVEVEFGNARIKGYSLDGTTETWSVAFETAHRTSISHRTGV